MSDSLVRLFISDIDGCLSEPYRPYNLRQFVLLAEYAAAAGRADRTVFHPAVSLCSGRAYAYVEAMSQLMGLQVPVLFESGGGMFDPLQARVLWNPSFTPEAATDIERVREWLIRECVPRTSMMYDYGKRTQAGIIGADEDEVARMVPIVEAYVAEHFPELHVFHTPVSIDVAAPGITKRQAVHWLAETTGVDTREMAFIGDTDGDIGAMEEVGFPLAPANATPGARAASKLVTRGRVIEGVVEAYRWCLAHNEHVLGRRA